MKVRRALAVVLAFGLAACAGACRREVPPRETPAARPEPSGDATIELVETPPVETTLDHADVANAPEVWVKMIDGARRTLDFAEFYASEAEPKDLATSKLAPVIAAIERAVARGVKVRFLADSVFAPKYPDTLDRLRKAGADVRILDFGKRGGGILHAKYFVVDGTQAFVGSQNFDWRALAHIQEIGVRVSSPLLAAKLLDVLDTDWELAAGAANDTRVRRRVAPAGGVDVRAKTGERLTVVASPRGWLPDESTWDLPRIVAMLDGAKRTVDVQVLMYKTKERDGSPFPTLDDALRRAAARGLRVRMLVSDWASKPGSDSRLALEQLATQPNVEVRVLTIPRSSGGDIPFARVAHAKYMVVDGSLPDSRAWVGTSNWEGDYFTKSRNVGVIAERGKLPAQLDGIFEDGWMGPYAQPLASIASADAGAARP